MFTIAQVKGLADKCVLYWFLDAYLCVSHEI
nr:MAG TPA: hypothetical protein [Caudoviricetes sp.]